MGLAEPRKRIKISHDPNNLAWSQSDSYGQKILSAHGWTPGSFLGARDAKHSSHYSDASASHIRISYKDDNLGLGAKSAGKLAEQSKHTDAFHGLLGRLNGKSENEIQKEQKKGQDLRLALYAKGKWGGMEFVRGGLLVQGKDFKEGVDQEQSVEETNQTTESNGDKADEEDKAARKRRKQEKKAAKETQRIQKEEVVASVEQSETQLGSEPVSESIKASKEERRRRKEAKRAAKLEKAERKQNKRSQNGSISPSVEEMATATTSRVRGAISESEDSQKLDGPASSRNQSSSVSREPSTAKSSPAPALPRFGRHVLRGRNIQSKRMAFQEAGGLDGIFLRSAPS